MKHCWHTKIHGAVPLASGGLFTVVCCWCEHTDTARTEYVAVPGHGPYGREVGTVYPDGECYKRPHRLDLSHPDDCECRKSNPDFRQPIVIRKNEHT